MIYGILKKQITEDLSDIDAKIDAIDAQVRDLVDLKRGLEALQSKIDTCLANIRSLIDFYEAFTDEEFPNVQQRIDKLNSAFTAMSDDKKMADSRLEDTTEQIDVLCAEIKHLETLE